MKKNYMMRIASVLLVVILLTTCAISATFAKYTSTGTGTATATVANWAFDFDATDAAATTTVAFDLFTTIKDSDGSTEDDVIADKIAPGTSGSFTIKLKNLSEVAATYAIDFEVTGGVPLEFKIGDGAWGAIADVAATNIAINTSADVTVQWRWPFTDTVENEHAGKTVTVTATVTASQVD